MKVPKKTLLVAVVVLVVAITSIVFVLYRPHKDPAIPASISKKTSFTVLQPDSQSYFIIPKTVTYTAANGTLSYKATNNDKTLTVTEQQIPDSFNDVPQLFPALLNKMHQYSEIQSASGTVALTHPTELKGGQTAVLKSSRGALIFVRPSDNLSDNQWKSFFDSLAAS